MLTASGVRANAQETAVTASDGHQVDGGELVAVDEGVFIPGRSGYPDMAAVDAACNAEDI